MKEWIFIWSFLREMACMIILRLSIRIFFVMFFLREAKIFLSFIIFFYVDLS